MHLREEASSKCRIVSLSTAPTLCRASIVSWTGAIASLRYFSLISIYLHTIAFLDQFRDLLSRRPKLVKRGLLELLLFIGIDALSRFGEAVDEHRALTLLEQNDGTVAARRAPRPGDPLLETGPRRGFFPFGQTAETIAF
jgi:hypothetical protein